jgi:hypothetical protein
MSRKHKVVRVGSTRVAPISAKERKEIARQIKKERKQLRKVYPEVHGKVVDFITHEVSGGTLYVSIRFVDSTNFSIRYGSEMFVVGVDLSDWKNSNMAMIREYMKPVPR